MHKNITLKESNYKELENIISRVAFENNIKDVEEISISLDSDRGIVKFKTSGQYPDQTSDPTMGGTPSTIDIKSQDQISEAIAEGDEEKRKKEEEEKTV